LVDIGIDTVEQNAAYKLATSVTGYTASYSITDDIGFPALIQILGLRPAAVVVSPSTAKTGILPPMMGR
jgi:hypothetical protein